MRILSSFPDADFVPFTLEHKPAPLAHLAFFEAIATYEDHSFEGRSAVAGLLVMRLLDHWLLSGPMMVQPESPSINTVRQSLAKLPSMHGQRVLMLQIVNTMQLQVAVDLEPLLPMLDAYAERLERDGEHGMAADVYAVITANATVATSPDLLIRAHLRTGFCRRTRAEFDLALQAYHRGLTLATRHGAVEAALRARSGLANVTTQQGNLPRADEMIESLLVDARGAGMQELVGIVMHSLTTVIYKRGDPVRAIRVAFESLGLLTDPAEKERVLVFLGGMFTVLERFDGARDAFRVLEASTQSEQVRSDALTGLLIVAARAGTFDEFTAARARVSERGMSAESRVNVFIESARGFARFNDMAAATAMLDEGRAFAESHGLNRSVFEAEALMDEVRRRMRPAYRDAVATARSDAVVEIIETNLRERATLVAGPAT